MTETYQTTAIKKNPNTKQTKQNPSLPFTITNKPPTQWLLKRKACYCTFCLLIIVIQVLDQKYFHFDEWVENKEHLSEASAWEMNIDKGIIRWERKFFSDRR